MARTETQNSPPDSITKTTESGAFIRTTYRKGKRRKQKTIRIKPNDEKYVIGHLGDFEVYIYPYDYPDKIFIGKFPVSTVIETWRDFFQIGMYAKNYIEGEYFKKREGWRKGANSRRRAIRKAYNLGLKRRSDTQNGQEKNKL